MSCQRSFPFLILLSATVLGAFPASADTLTFKCGPLPNGKGLPENLVVDTATGALSYQVMQEDGVTPWSDLGHAQATVDNGRISWVSDPVADAPRTYDLDRNTGIQTARWQDSGAVNGELTCRLVSQTSSSSDTGANPPPAPAAPAEKVINYNY
jgi:hypothetical protein